jgi:hypothetical protein
MRPEITQYLVKITAELADILGIAWDEGKFTVDFLFSLISGERPV